MEGACPHCKGSFEPGFRYCPHCGFPVAQVQSQQGDPLLGKALAGGYVVLELVGTGGMGRVYRAEQSVLRRSVAIKLIHPHLVNDAGAASRFVNEAHAASRLNHPNVVSVIDFGRTDEGLPFIVMEYLRGPSLATVIENEGLVSVARAISIVRQVLDALSEAHELGIIHRDLKPANIALEPTRSGEDFVKVLDFGLAQVVADPRSPSAPARRDVMGTPAYMSPEQAAGTVVDHRSDLYSLGVIFYELATGLRLSRAETALAAVVERMAASAPEESDIAKGRPVPQPFVPVIIRAMAADPASRFASAQEFRLAIDRADAQVAGHCGRPTMPVPSGALPCPSCGIPVPQKDRFCGGCGERIAPSTNESGVPSAPVFPPPPFSGVRRGRRTTRLQLRANAHEPDLRWLHDMRLDSTRPTTIARIVGAPGSGRTTILREFMHAARSGGDLAVELCADRWWAKPACHGLRALISRLANLPQASAACAESRGAAPSAALGLRLVLDGAMPRDLGVSPADARMALADALRWAIERGAGGALTGRVVLGVDDFERIDGPTRNALMDLLTRPLAASLMIVTTQSLQARHEWPVPVEEHLLQGWETAAACEALSVFGKDITLPAQAMDGRKTTPLYLEQLVRYHFEGGRQPAPETSDLVARRIENLSADARQILQALAVLGDNVAIEDLADITPATRDVDRGLFGLAQACVVERGDEGLRWAHPLLREIAAASIPAAIRRDMHARALRSLEMRNAPLEVLAVHATLAEQWFEALFMVEQAAERAMSLGDVAGTAEWLRFGYLTVQRAAAARGLDDPEKAYLSFGRKLGDALLDAGQLSEADVVLREVLEVVGPSSAGCVQILRGLARVQRGGSGSGDPMDVLRAGQAAPDSGIASRETPAGRRAAQAS